MGWRVVIVEKRCKLEYKTGYLVCRGEDIKRVFIDEISTLIVQNTAVSITGVLLCELVKHKVNIVFCDERQNPISQLNALYGRHDCSGRVREQNGWSNEIKSKVWAEIVKNKITQQASFLDDLGSPQAEMLKGYVCDVQIGDITNREGHAAKVYFNALFGLGFKRSDDERNYNAMLDYGYAILLSAFNREIIADGYLTQCGLFHRNEFNHFNLSSDLMEPFRVIVDRKVFMRGEGEVTTMVKQELADLLNLRVEIAGKTYTVNDAISLYCKRVFNALNESDPSQLVFYEL